MVTVSLEGIATAVAAVIALVVFIVNSTLQRRAIRVENLNRFFDTHRRLFAPHGYLEKHVLEFNALTMRRDFDDAESEAEFHTMLLEVERLAIMANDKAVPESTQVYMFGWYAQRIKKLISEKERENMFWELAVSYVERLASLADDYERMTVEQRRRYQR